MELVWLLVVVPSLLTQHVAAQSYQLHDADDYQLPGASQSCLDAYNANVSCSDTIGYLYGIASPDLSSDELSGLCTSDCFTSLINHRDNVVQSCGSVQYYDDLEGSSWDVSYLDDEVIYAYNLTCLRRRHEPLPLDGTYCNSWFQETRNDSSTSSCDSCYLETLFFQAESDLSSDATGYSSMYQSLARSCGHSGPAPTSPSSLVSSSTAPSPTCSGSVYTIKSGDTYNSVARSQGIATSQLLQSNGLSYNVSDFPKSGSLCITNLCSTHVVQENDTCTEIASKGNITAVQLKTWNLNINGLCSNLGNLTGQTICLTNPFGNEYMSLAATSHATAVATAAPVPSTVASGVNSNCGQYYQISSGDTCATVSLKYNIELDDFYFLNRGLDANCTNLLLGYSYCVMAVGKISTYSGYGTTTTMKPIVPASKTSLPFYNISATHNVVAPTVIPFANDTRVDCWGYIWINETADVDTTSYDCWDMAAASNLTPEEFALWNPSLDQNPADADNKTYNYQCTLAPSLSYCNVLASPTPATAYTIPVPEPTAVGQIGNCTRWTTLPSDYTCADLLRDLKLNIADLYTMNPSIKSDCTGMAAGTYYCISILEDGTPGISPPDDSTVKSSATSSGAPGPTQSGVISSCSAYLMANPGGSCTAFASRAGISLSQLYAWNSVLGPNGENCASQFWGNEYYCVAVSSSSPSSTTTRVSSVTKTSASANVPGPTQDGIISTCNKYLMANPGGSCAAFADRAGISLTQLYAWNSVLGSNGENCASQFWGNEYYCVGVSATTPTATTKQSISTNSVMSAPGPTQSGITRSCNKFLMANAGGSCTAFASRAGISLQQLYAWNSVLGSDGENCVSQFWGNEYYCVGVSGSSSVASPSPTTSTVSAPGPTQTGIVKSCNKFLMANPGGSCSVFASRAGITTQQLYQWNTVLGKSGENCSSQFWANEYYCVGVSS